MLLVRVADVVIARELLLPVAGRHRNDFRAPLLGLLDGVDRRRVVADVVEDDEQIVALHVVVADEARAVPRRALDLDVLRRLAQRGDVVAVDGVDVGEAAGAEEHLADHHDRVPPAAVDVDQPVLLVRVGHHRAGPAEVVGLRRFDGVEFALDVGEVRGASRFSAHGGRGYRGPGPVCSCARARQISCSMSLRVSSGSLSAVSVPAPPKRKSTPASPKIRSSPAPPRRLSVPSPPKSRSPPAPPVTESSPSPASTCDPFTPAPITTLSSPPNV